MGGLNSTSSSSFVAIRPKRWLPETQGPLLTTAIPIVSLQLSYTLPMPRVGTHREIEIKLAIKDVGNLIEKLRAMGVKPRGRVLEQNTLFDTDGSDLRQGGRLLRLRTETPAPSPFATGGHRRRTLTSKSRPLPERNPRKKRLYRENLEREIAVATPSPDPRRRKRTLRDRGWPFALGVLGFRSGFRYEKYRTAFRSHGLHLDLDETPVGVFLELEGQPDAIDRVAGALGFTPRDYIRATYYELYAAERRRRGRAVRHMEFSR
jgi:adenylate cyclase class 2